MDLLKIIKKRRSIRRFDPNKQVKFSNFKKIIEAWLYAPSNKNSNTREILIINSSKKKQLTKLIDNKRIWEGYDYLINIIKYSSRLILIFNNKNKIDWIKLDLDNNINSYNYISEILSIGACIENMLLEATFLWIDSLIIRDIVVFEDSIKELLWINKDFDLISWIVFWYRASKNKKLPKAKVDFRVNKDWFVNFSKNITYPQ